MQMGVSYAQSQMLGVWLTCIRPQPYVKAASAAVLTGAHVFSSALRNLHICRAHERFACG